MGNTQRELFEKWAKQNDVSTELGYIDKNTQLLWEAWQAAAETSGCAEYEQPAVVADIPAGDSDYADWKIGDTILCRNGDRWISFNTGAEYIVEDSQADIPARYGVVITLNGIRISSNLLDFVRIRKAGVPAAQNADTDSLYWSIGDILEYTGDGSTYFTPGRRYPVLGVAGVNLLLLDDDEYLESLHEIDPEHLPRLFKRVQRKAF